MEPGNQAQNGIYTAAELAGALGVSVEIIRRTLRDNPATGMKCMGKGVATRAWALGVLPEAMRAKLARTATERGWGTIDELLRNRPAPWHPPLPLQQIEARWIQRAFSLQRALKPSLEKLNDVRLDKTEFAREGLANYEREFGFAVSPDHWRRLLNRAVWRDRGCLQWERVELYLDDAAFRTKVEPGKAGQVAYQHQELGERIADLKMKRSLTGDERASLFNDVFWHFEGLCLEQPEERKKIKKSLLLYLIAFLPHISKTEAALRRMFDDKYAQWSEQGRTASALKDQRKNNGAEKKHTEEDAMIVAAIANKREGNESGAYRTAIKQGLIQGTLDMRRNKSYMPKTLRDDVTDIHLKTRHFDKGEGAILAAMPRGTRDYSGLRAGDIFEADDLTVPFYWKAVGEDGRPKLMRGECLVFSDFRSGLILDFLLIAGKYNSLHIRRGMLMIHDKYGLPRKGFQFENGPWKARLIEGEKVQGFEDVGWRFLADGLMEQKVGVVGGVGEAGIKVHHAKARNPQTKAIEQIFNVTQNLMAPLPGFVGRNERLDGYERAHKLIRAAESGDERAIAQLFTQSEAVRALETVFAEYNSEPQNGNKLQGLSPLEMWRSDVENAPLRKLPDDARFLLSSHKKITTPRANGAIEFDYQRKRVFANKQIGGLHRRKEVIVWWHIDRPEFITVTDLKMQNPIVLRELKAPANGASREELGEYLRSQKAAMEAGKVIHSNLPQNVISTITRDNDHSSQVKELGRLSRNAIDAEMENAEAENNKLRRIQRKAAAAGQPVNLDAIRNPDRVAEGLEIQEAARARIAAKKAGLDTV